MNPWIQFGLSAFLVVIAGVKLTGYADNIASKTKLGGLWVGSILLALATSLPEVVTAVSSGILEFPDIAIGNVLGSNIFNIAIIAMLDLMDGKRSILAKVSLGHVLAGAFGMVLACLVVIGILVDFPEVAFGIGLDSVIILAVYLFGVRMITRYEKRSPEDHEIIWTKCNEEECRVAEASEIPLNRSIIGFIIMSIAIVVAGTFLSISGERIAVITGLGSSFIGSTLVAIATSLPEIVAGVTAVRIGAFDLAIGNLLGSNIFNMLIVVVADIFYRPGPILLAVAPVHAVTAIFGLLLSSVVVIGLFYRSHRSYFHMGPDTILIFIGYLAATYMIYILR
ncbi:MAG: sodium:calcium antiporter [Bacillota bacterium]|nr:sodium:calcium antiporter [Bacillota bacterium]